MSNFRIPGPLRSVRRPWLLDDGILALTAMSRPRALCSISREHPAEAMPGPPAAAQRGSDLSFLFNSSRNPARGVSEADYAEAALLLGVEVEAIQAVAEVETSGNAFDDKGRPRILYERHYFHRLTNGKYAAAHPVISNAIGGGYGKFSAQYTKLEEAYGLDADAALRSASWGRFQIMGDNYRAAGFGSVSEFVLAHVRAEAEHLKAFVNFVSNDKTMKAALGNKEWAAFASAYNGKGYKKNDYDTKMADAYARLTMATH
jgi:hypothetical protein